MIEDHKIVNHPINETATTPSEPSASNSTSDENPYRLTPEQMDDVLTWLKEMIRDGVIQNTQFTIKTG